jgi:hypothetical protein
MNTPNSQSVIPECIRYMEIQSLNWIDHN